MGKKKTILVAPLHWGLGHATRCIPIINSLLDHGFNVIIASDGSALLLLQKEFSKLNTIELPSYNISYPKKGAHFKWKIFLKLPRILKVISSEKKIVQELVSEARIDGIISDNRFGIRSDKVPSVYLSHQLNVLSGSTSNFSSKRHQNIIKKFTECWVPDFEGSENLSGKLGHLDKDSIKPKYIGILSRMKKKDLEKKYDVLVLLSGPEPQRSFLEKKMILVFRWQKKSVLLIQGCVGSQQEVVRLGNLTICNYMNSKELEDAINESEVIVSRSGYTSIMDLAAIGKKAFFIPTPGQFEQEYLAKRMEKLKMAPYCQQDEFTIDKLEEINSYKGMYSNNPTLNYTTLFNLFEAE